MGSKDAEIKWKSRTDACESAGNRNSMAAVAQDEDKYRRYTSNKHGSKGVRRILHEMFYTFFLDEWFFEIARHITRRKLFKDEHPCTIWRKKVWNKKVNECVWERQKTTQELQIDFFSPFFFEEVEEK